MKTLQSLLLLALIAFVPACSCDKSAVTNETEARAAVESLRTAMLSGEKAALEAIAADTLLYIHSSGKIQTKPEYVQTFVDKDSVFKTLEFSDITIKITGDTVIVNHKLKGDTADKGKAPGTANLGVTLTYKKLNGALKLISRQAYKL